MNTAESNYPTHEREILAIIPALRTLRHYLEGNQVQHYHKSSFAEAFNDATKFVKASSKMVRFLDRI